MHQVLMAVVIYLEKYIVNGMVSHYQGSSLDSLLEKDRDEFLEIKNARIFSEDGRELYSVSLLEVNKSRVVMMFLEEAVITRGE